MNSITKKIKSIFKTAHGKVFGSAGFLGLGLACSSCIGLQLAAIGLGALGGWISTLKIPLFMISALLMFKAFRQATGQNQCEVGQKASTNGERS